MIANNPSGEPGVILPGLQALFGFLTIAVFTQRFAEIETCANVALAMVMPPAVYCRARGGRATTSPPPC